MIDYKYLCEFLIEINISLLKVNNGLTRSRILFRNALKSRFFTSFYHLNRLQPKSIPSKLLINYYNIHFCLN